METEILKKLPAHELHIRYGAKMIPFAGFEMPVSYKGLNEEHLSVRSKAGIFDVSHMGEFLMKGEDALKCIQYLTCNDVSVLVPGKIQYSALMNEKGGIVDDLLVYCLNKDEYLLVVNASNIEKDKKHILKYAQDFKVTLEDISEQTALFAVQGPKASGILQKLTRTDLSAIPYYNFGKGIFAGIPDVIMSNTGYTGAGGFEIYIPASKASSVWNEIMKAGEQEGLIPSGLGARDTLRLEMGFCLYGNDINEETSPLEAGLGWIVKTDKGDFLGKAVLEKQKKEGLKRKLCGFVMTERGIPRKGYVVTDENGNQIGQVTSGTQSPVLQQGIGLAYLSIDKTIPGTEIFIQIRERPHKAKVTRLPFISKKT